MSWFSSTTAMGAGMGRNNSLLDVLPSSSAVHVVMLGLDSAGKTTALYRLKFDQYLNTVPTIGFNCEKIRGQGANSRGVTFMVWDIGGQERLRPLWRSYTRCTDGIIFVVDSVDAERLEEARLEISRVSKCPENAGAPFLILANKQDLPDAKSTSCIIEALALKELEPGHLWHVQPACAIIGEGLHTGLDALYQMIVKCRKAARTRRKK